MRGREPQPDRSDSALKPALLVWCSPAARHLAKVEDGGSNPLTSSRAVPDAMGAVTSNTLSVLVQIQYAPGEIRGVCVIR